MGGASAGAIYDIIFSTKASLRRMRTCLLAFHVTEEYPHGDVIGDVIPEAGFSGSVSDDVIIAGGGRQNGPGRLLSLNDEDVDDVTDNDLYDVTKVESRSSLDYRKAESIV